MCLCFFQSVHEISPSCGLPTGRSHFLSQVVQGRANGSLVWLKQGGRISLPCPQGGTASGSPWMGGPIHGHCEGCQLPWATVGGCVCVAAQVSLPMGFSRQECCSGLPCPTPEYLPDPGSEPTSPAPRLVSSLREHST